MDKRPPLNKQISVKDFKDFYWLKEELLTFCRSEGLPLKGSKIELANAIVLYLETGKKSKNIVIKTTSSFDWAKEVLTLDTIITDNYKNAENVRAFFVTQLGKGFKFNVQFMNWMKANVGATLADAVKAWQDIQTANKNNTAPKDIAPQFEYNTYIRDFLADNPTLSRAEAIAFWKIKRSMRGDNIYKKSDLKLDQNE